MKIQSRQQEAFSLIETIIAVSILALVLLFSITLGSVSLRNMVIKAETVQATTLARSQIEKVRNIRDNTWVNSEYANCSDRWACWVRPSHNTLVTTGEYQLKGINNYYLSVEPAEIKQLIFGENSQVDYKASVRVSRVTRVGNEALLPINLDNTSGPDEATNLTTGTNIKIYLVTSKVDWESYGRPYSITLSTYLSDWFPRF